MFFNYVLRMVNGLLQDERVLWFVIAKLLIFGFFEKYFEKLLFFLHENQICCVEQSTLNLSKIDQGIFEKMAGGGSSQELIAVVVYI
jgi:hypothetical protein